MIPTVIFILGPTSSGKSAVAARLAEKINGEIVSCDSMQIYRDMDIITQAPQKKLLSRVTHHLIRTITPEQEFSAAKFVEEAENIISDIFFRNKVPVFAGGTGLYVKSLVDGIFPAPPKDEVLRKELEALAADNGNEYLHVKLKSIDPETASVLHVNDTRRIIRALEVYELTDQTIHEKRKETSGISQKYDCKMFGLELPREVLYSHINDAVEKMFDAGLVDEVRRFRECEVSLTAEQALGVKEASAFLDKKISLEEAKEELKKNTRRYAKRQLTWFRGDKRIVWIDANRAMREIVNEIEDKLQEIVH